jgi:predicted metal-binding membrane protein
MWAVMMAGMMAPSAAPVFLLYAQTRSTRSAGATSPAVFLFGSGYLAVWTAFSAAAALAQWALHQAALLSPAMQLVSPRIAGTLLIAAGAYQLAPWKQKCLAHCRSPLGFLMTYWRNGLWGAFQMGFSHGLFCLGCCWALMILLFALGVMNLIWVAALTAFILLEKVGPAGVIAGRLAGAALLIFGILRILY